MVLERENLTDRELEVAWQQIKEFREKTKAEINNSLSLESPVGENFVIKTFLGNGWSEQPLTYGPKTTFEKGERFDSRQFRLTPFRAAEVLMFFAVLKGQPELSRFFGQEFVGFHEKQGRGIYYYWREIGEKEETVFLKGISAEEIIGDRRKLGRFAEIADVIHRFLIKQPDFKDIPFNERSFSFWQIFDGKDIGYKHLVLSQKLVPRQHE